MAKNTVKSTKQRLMDEMAKLPTTSPEFSKLNTELVKLADADTKDSSWKWQVGASISSTIVNAGTIVMSMMKVLKHEDRGNVLTTKATNYIPKPKI